jgi:homoserine dehydrogenase
MQNNHSLTIGIFGFGTVGEGIYQVLQQTPSLQALVKRVCIKHGDKKRNAPASLFTTRYEDLLDDPGINVIVELIDDAAEAYTIVTSALRKGKAVVSANKKMIAARLPELIALQEETGQPLLYEAAVCGSIPIIRNLEEYYDNDLLRSLSGIVNGSTNYILTQMGRGKRYREALGEAQQLGFAESDPSLDVEGWDAVNKLVILLTHAYGIHAGPESLLRCGITRIHSDDAGYAREKGYVVRLTAQACQLDAGRVAAFVLPQFIPAGHLLYGVQDEYNGVVIESKLADRQFLYGKGAGRFPTASAVASDLSALRYGYRYEYKRRQRAGAHLSNQYYLRVYVSFPDWSAVSKWDFEEVTEFHSTADRQYLVGLIAVEKLQRATWLSNETVSIILLPEAIETSEAQLARTLKKVSLQLAGVR